MKHENFDAPLLLYRDRVRDEWVDEYDHMNLAYYVLVCDQATYAFWEMVNDGNELDDRNGMEYAVVESHVNYVRELRLDDPVRVTTRLLAHDSKRFRIFHELHHDGDDALSATNEIMALGFSLTERKICEFTADVQRNLAAVRAGHGKLEMPERAGRSISFTNGA